MQKMERETGIIIGDISMTRHVKEDSTYDIEVTVSMACNSMIISKSPNAD